MSECGTCQEVANWHELKSIEQRAERDKAREECGVLRDSAASYKAEMYRFLEHMQTAEAEVARLRAVIAEADADYDIPGYWFIQYQEDDRDCDGIYPIEPPIIVLAEHLDDALNNAGDLMVVPDGCRVTRVLIERRATWAEIQAHLAKASSAVGELPIPVEEVPRCKACDSTEHQVEGHDAIVFARRLAQASHTTEGATT